MRRDHSFPDRPDFLEEDENNFEKTEDSTTDSTRWVHYTKQFASRIADAFFEIRFRYELTISDDPFATWTENTSYCLEGVDMSVCEGAIGDCSSETDYIEIRVESISELNHLLKMLTGQNDCIKYVGKKEEEEE